MELKPYQHKVIQDIESYMEYLQEYQHIGNAFNKYWEDKIGVYNPLEGTGMQPYKNNIPNAIQLTVKVPTAGGKTFIAVNALKTIFDASSHHKAKAVVWLVPWSNLLDQTINNLRDADHPYRQKLNTLFNNRVVIYDKKDLLQGSNFNPTSVNEQLSIVVMSFASLRARNKEDRKVYQENGQLASFVSQYKNSSHLLEEVDETALINVIRSLNPVVIVDESHNAESDLSVEMLKNLNPSFILDLTATPKNNSNIVSLVPASDLKKENMVKLPVIVYNHTDKTRVVESALHLQNKLEYLAKIQEKQGGRYIRPIVLFQAQPKNKKDNTTFEKLKAQLLKLKIPEEQIKIKTANINELKGIDLMSKDCEVRYIITINALKEGWDCPFAYILASLADKSSAVDVEQILGRVLRQPYVQKHQNPLLNVSFVLTASSKFHDTLKNIVSGLQASGFSEKDYRKKDAMPDFVKEEEKQATLENFLFPDDSNSSKDKEDNTLEEDLDIDTNTIVLPTNIAPTPENKNETDLPINPIVKDIEEMAIAQNEEMEAQIEAAKSQSSDENLFAEMGDKVKRYAIKATNIELANQIKLPQFFMDIGNNIFGDEKVLLNSESLLKNFKLSNEDTKINFDDVASELYKVDIDKDNEYRPTITQIEDIQVKEPLIDYILAKPKDQQIKDVTYQLMAKIGNMFPIPDQEIQKYITRILDQMTTEQLRDVLNRQYSYKDKIKKKIKALARDFAANKFDEMTTLNKIYVEESWSFKERIVPGNLGSPIGNSLYEREGNMNKFEEKVILGISSFPNIAFWHRNLERGKGFSINGFNSNHYPDFIIVTKGGSVILLETKGDHLDNTDSLAKIRLGEKWASMSGKNYHYFMVFDTKDVKGAYTLDKAKDLIKQL